MTFRWGLSSSSVLFWRTLSLLFTVLITFVYLLRYYIPSRISNTRESRNSPTRAGSIHGFFDTTCVRLTTAISSPYYGFRITTSSVIVAPNIGVFQTATKTTVITHRLTHSSNKWHHYPKLNDPSELMWLKSDWSEWADKMLNSTTQAPNKSFIILKSTF